MELAAEDLLFYASAAVLNFALAALVLRVTPRRPGNRLFAAVFLLHGAYATAQVLVPVVAALTGVPSEYGSSYQQLTTVIVVGLNSATLAPLTLIPFVVPWRRASRRTLVALATLVLALVLVAQGLAALRWAELVEPSALAGAPWFIAVIHATAVLSTFVLLDSALLASGPLQRRTAAILLAGSLLRVACTGLTTMGSPDGSPASPDGGLVNAAADVTRALITLAWWVLVAVALAVPATLALNRARGGPGTGSVRSDLFVCAMVPLGLLLGWGLHAQDAEYLLVRPVLLAYALLQFQMLGVDVRRHEVTLGVAVLAALLGLFVVVQRGASAALGASATALALVASLGVAGALALPLLRILLHPADADAPRRLLVYRAALEAAQREGDAGAAATLKALRRELGVSDREHALLAGAVGGSSAHALAPGELLLDRYRIVRPLGQGASGEVVLARDERLQRDVAIKRLAGHVRRDARAVRSFEREMRLASALHHPNVVAVHDVETIGDDAYLIMEHMVGGSLQDRIDRDGKVDEREARRIVGDVLAALAALHAKGIVHRDVKPSNVLLDGAGRAKLADFTIARDAVSGETVGGPAERPAGTWAYMSPEQARGLPATPRSDLYATGATLYAALTGAPPIGLDGEAEHAARMRVAREAPALPLDGISEGTNAALARALARSPSDRFPDAADMARALGA